MSSNMLNIRRDITQLDETSKKDVKMELVTDDSSMLVEATSESERVSIHESDCTCPSKVANTLFFRRYDPSEIQKDFPLTVDVHKEGDTKYLVEPRPGLKPTDYYVDYYAWNKGKNTTTKRKIFVEVLGDELKCTRKDNDNAQFILHWFYANMENRLTKKVSWLVSTADGSRVSPVLVHYTVHFISSHPVDMRKPRLYSDAKNDAKRRLETAAPMTVCANFEESRSDPREILTRKQVLCLWSIQNSVGILKAYDLRRSMDKKRDPLAPRRGRKPKKEEIVEEIPFGAYPDVQFFDETQGEEMYEETVYYEEDEDLQPPIGAEPNLYVGKLATEVARIASKQVETRMNNLLESRLGLYPARRPSVRVPILNNADLQSQADMIGGWINTLANATPGDVDVIVSHVVGSMRRRLDDLIAADEPPTTRQRAPQQRYSPAPPAKRQYVVARSAVQQLSDDARYAWKASPALKFSQEPQPPREFFSSGRDEHV